MFSSYRKFYIVDLLLMKGLNYKITKYKELICTYSYLYHVELCSLEVDSTKELLREKVNMFNRFKRSYIVDFIVHERNKLYSHEV